MYNKRNNGKMSVLYYTFNLLWVKIVNRMWIVFIYQKIKNVINFEVYA